LATSYAHRRQVFGKLLAEQPLHLETLADMQVELHAAFHLAFRVVELLGRDECREASQSEKALLRLLIPVAKLQTAKQAVALASEAVESFGGAGYIENTGIPRLLRDAQVLTIWEGTTNVLSLDTLRAVGRGDVLRVWTDDVRRRLAELRTMTLGEECDRTLAAVERIQRYADDVGDDLGVQQAGARRFAFAIGRTESAVLLLEHAVAQPHAATIAAARRWCARDLAPVLENDAAHRQESTALADAAWAPDVAAPATSARDAEVLRAL
jgi:hypothetical protein